MHDHFYFCNFFILLLPNLKADTWPLHFRRSSFNFRTNMTVSRLFPIITQTPGLFDLNNYSRVLSASSWTNGFQLNRPLKVQSNWSSIFTFFVIDCFLPKKQIVCILGHAFLSTFSILSPAYVQNWWASDIKAANNPEDIMERGILFKDGSTISLTRNFFGDEFCLRFPTHAITTKTEIAKWFNVSHFCGESPSFHCP